MTTAKLINSISDKLCEIGHTTVKNYKTDLLRDLASIMCYVADHGKYPEEVHIYARENGTHTHKGKGHNYMLEYYYTGSQVNFEPTMVVYVLKIDAEEQTADFAFIGDLVAYDKAYNINSPRKAEFITALEDYHVKMVLASAEKYNKNPDPEELRFAVNQIMGFHHSGQFDYQTFRRYINALDFSAPSDVLDWARESLTKVSA